MVYKERLKINIFLCRAGIQRLSLYVYIIVPYRLECVYDKNKLRKNVLSVPCESARDKKFSWSESIDWSQDVIVHDLTNKNVFVG